MFDFVPWNFGPFSKGVHEAVDFLDGCGLVEIEEREVESVYATREEALLLEDIATDSDRDTNENQAIPVREKVFTLTDDGKVVASKLRELLFQKKPADCEAIDSVVSRFGAKPLGQIIRYVYHRYPLMTTNSIHPEAKRVSSSSSDLD
ncbi:hypothetical protein [Stratiformator vulcanicus]|nr:hypothetical protein [Stratiformator vulcanicus]